MIVKNKKVYTAPASVDLQVDYFNGGLNTLQESNRLKKNEASKADNLMLVGEGFWSKRWGTKTFGGDAGGSQVDGSEEYIKSDGTRELIVVANGKVWRWGTVSYTEITGATFTAGKPCSMLQIDSFLYIANGYDDLARYNGTDLDKYTELSAPTGVTATKGAGLTSGSFNNYYVITALNEVGETVGSTEVNTTTNIKREDWTGATQIMTVAWSASAGAIRYQIYYDDESGYEVLLDETTALSYVDDGSKIPNIYIETPDDNTTSGPKFSDMCLSSNRIWGTRDPGNKYRVYFSGTGVNRGTFSDFYGGGWIDLEKGGRDTPEAVRHYKTSSGSGSATVFCSTPEGKGSIWQIMLDSTTVEGVSFIVPIPNKVVGSIGTSAPRSVINVGDDIFFFNKDGIFVLGNEPNFFNVLRTNELSARIRPLIRSIDSSKISGVSAFFHDQKVFFSIPKSTQGNNKIIYYDMERKAWVGEWSIGFTTFIQHTDVNYQSRLLGGSTSSGEMIELSSAYLDDDGVPFSTYFLSPKYPSDKNWTEFAKIKKCYFRLNNVRGAVSVSIIGSEKRRENVTQGSKQIVTESTNTGLGWDLLASNLLGTSTGKPIGFEFNSIKRYIKLNKRLSDLQFSIQTSSSESVYTLIGLKATGTKLRTNNPSDWRLN